MYLAHQTIGGKRRFFIRQSYSKGSHLVSRDLIDLGSDPGRFVIYPGGSAYYLNEALEDRLRELKVDYDPDELDDLFFPFLDPQIRYKLEWIARRRSRKQTIPTTENSPSASYHLFDKRRIHFLRHGSMDQGYIGRISPKMLRALNAKSRDEIEQYVMEMETDLRPAELKSYVFVIFDLQRFFTERFARTSPQLLTGEEVDDYFVKEVCRLNDDPSFWAGMDRDDCLHTYLVRYVTMFFDYDYGQGRFLDDVIRDFINNHRQYQPPKSVRVKMTDAAAIFNTDTDTLKGMSRAELGRAFRRRAQQLHPDKGGEHDKFVQLVGAYHSLLNKKH